jgi:hypothetical protein
VILRQVLGSITLWVGTAQDLDVLLPVRRIAAKEGFRLADGASWGGDAAEALFDATNTSAQQGVDLAGLSATRQKIGCGGGI